MVYRKFNLISRLGWLALLWALAAGVATAQPTATAGSIIGTTSEDFGTAPNLFRLSSYFTDDVPSHTITYSLQGSSGDTVAVLSVDPGTGWVSITSIPDAYGSQTFTLVGTDDVGLFDTLTFQLNVAPVNDDPSFTAGGNVTALEDAGAQTESGWATNVSAGPNEGDQTVTFDVVGNTNPGLFATAPAIDSSGTLTYTPAADANGSAQITVQLEDSEGAISPTRTFTIGITPVNDAPSFTKGGNQTVLEDAGAQTVPGWVTSMSAGPADEAPQTFTFNVVGNTNPGLFATAPVVDATGNLSYAPAADAFGTADISITLSDSGGTANGGVDTSAVQTFTITVDPVNDAPSFTGGGNVAVLEDSGAQSVTGWATAISPGPGETGQVLTFTVVGNSDTALFAAQPAVDPVSGTLTFAPAADASGSADVTIELSDDGGTANGGANTSDPLTFTITVGSVNDIPTFTGGADETVLEDSGAQTVSGWATAISAGPDENGQAVSFEVTDNTNTGLFAAAPAIDSSGTLTYTPAADANGSADITVVLKDDGGTVDGGEDTSSPYTFTITIDPVNDAPSFGSAGDVTVLEDSGPQSVTGWASPVSAGPADESAQTLTFDVVGNTNPGLFATQPAVDPVTGTLTFTPVGNASGSADITLELSDDGGVANGGVNTSGPQTFTITVGPVNDAPSFTSGGDVTVLEDSGAQTFPAWASSLSPGSPDESSQTLAFNVVGIINSSLFAVPPAVDGTTGDLTFTPAANANGSATVTLNISDDGGTAGGGVDTSPNQTFTITVTPVNDAPRFTSGGNVSVPEDSGPQTVTGWAGAISEGPSDEDGQSLSFVVVSNSNPALFSTAPAVDATTGNLTFAAPAEVNGSATITLELVDDGGTADGGVDTSPQVTFVIAVGAVNDEPSFTAGGDQTVLEDAAPVTVPGWATDLSAGPPNESGQTLTFNIVSNSNPALFAAGPAVDGATGALTFTPAPDMNGTATISLTVSDSGGTGSGGDNTSPAQSFTITVDPVNDAPTFTPGPNVAAQEDAGPKSFPWATDISPGPADESGQTVTFNIVGNTNPALFSEQPAIDPITGVLTFRSAPNEFGLAIITVNLSDDGGTANGGEDTSEDVSFEIDIGAVNDIPVAADDAATMAEDGDQILIAVLDNDDLGDEPTKIVSAGVNGFSQAEPVVLLDDSGVPITDDQGGIEPNGQVTVDGNQIYYQPKANYHGEDFFTYTIADDNGDTATGTVRVTVTPVNDPPSNVPQEFERNVLENGVLVVDAASGPLALAYDVDGAVVDPDTGEAVGGVSFSMQVVSFPLVGSLTIDPANGAFEYAPPVDFVGDVVFEYRVSDGVLLSEETYRVLVHVLEAPEPPAPPPAGEVAIPFNLSNVPLEQSTSVPPNVLVVMDDSGSMDWNLVTTTGGQEGQFDLENSDFAFVGRYSTGYSYLWDLRSNAYPPSSDNGRILPTEEALIAFAQGQGWEPADPYGVWRARSHVHNRLYYNPEILYTPWIGQDANNIEFADADPQAIRLDPVSPTNVVNVLEPHSYTATRVPEWDWNGGTARVDVDDMYIPHYYRTPATPPLEATDDRELVTIRPGEGPLDGDFPGGPQRADCAADDDDPGTCTYEQEIQNFANYFQYYRSREYVTKNGIGKVVARVQDVRVGYETISATTSIPIRDMNPLHTEGDKKALLDNVYRVDSYGGTPLRQALGRAGQIFSCSTGNDCPALPAPEGFCQQNFALLFSDGYWTGGTGTTGNPDGDDSSPFDGGRYEDGFNATLADVAMHYYETDLQPTLVNEVPVMVRDRQGAPDGVFPELDAKMHQHMKTYTIAFGVVGTVSASSVPSNPLTPFAWPDPFSGNLQKVDDMLHTAVNGRGRFLNANTPQELQAAFESTFLEFTAAASSTSSAAFNSTSLQEGTLLYRGFYDLRDNTGELTATVVRSDGTLDPAGPKWFASEELDTFGGNWEQRSIVTFDPVTRAGIPFAYESLTPEQQVVLNEDQVDFLRGDRSNEQDQPAGVLRERPISGGLLGDIVNSSPVFVGTPRAINRDQAPYPTDDLYSDFVLSVQDRTPVVYVGANDGMMHGFDATFDEGTSGKEMFAYVPNKIIDSSQTYANLLDTFTLPFYQHRYFVDLTPRLNDVYMRPSRSSVDKRWNTVLVGGLGAGGKGFFALNVTSPSQFSTSVSAANTVLWEFTDDDDTYPRNAAGVPLGGAVGALTDPQGRPVKDLGYALSLPGVAMSNVNDSGSPAQKEWVAIFGNGQNSTAGTAKLFVLFMDRGLDGWTEGTDFIKLDTGFGVPLVPHSLAGYPNGLGSPAAVDRNLDGTVDWVYAGDRLGNLFRFDLEDSDPDNWTVTRIFTATYDSGAGETIQPIVTQPLVVKHPTEQGFLVIFGTGSYVTQDDADSEDIQSIYAIWDRGASSPATAFPDTKAVRLVEQEMTNVVDDSVSPAQTRRILTKHPVDYQLEGDTPGTYGWYIDLDMPRAASTLSGGVNGDTSGRSPPGAQYPGEKAIRRLLFRDGVVITTTVLPSLDEFSCFGTRPGSIILFDSVTGGDPGRPVVDFNTDGYVSGGDLVMVGDAAFAGGLLFNQSDVDGQLVDLSTLGGEGNTDWLFVSGGNETVSFRIDDINDSRTGRLSWRELDGSN